MQRHPAPLLLFYLPTGLYLAVLMALAVFVLHPPALGWIGLAVTGVLAFAVAGVATRLFARMRTNADRQHPHAGAVHRVLVVLDGDVPPWRLLAGLQPYVSGKPHELFVVAPVTGSFLHFLTEDEAQNHEAAQRRLEGTLRQLGRLGISAQGRLGTDDPLQAIGDALASFPADEVVVVDGGKPASLWLERDLERTARDLFGVHVSGIHREVTA